MPTFTPPTVLDVPAVFGQDRENRHPWANFAAKPRGVNVFKLTDGSYTQVQPNDWATIAAWYYGGHSHTVSAGEAALLTAAGYGPYVV
jgi:hypothetical protein